MNRNSEQVDGGLNVTIDQDQPLKGMKLYHKVCEILGDRSSIETFVQRQHYIKFKPMKGKTIALLVKSITYLGNPHPIFKKRIQIPQWWLEFVRTFNEVYDIRFIGVYHYDGMVIFSDFDKSTYITRSVNNSSAHVYTNDLYQALSYGVFTKKDQYNNLIHTVSLRHFGSYLNGVLPIEHNKRQQIFNVFKKFNDSFNFDTEILASTAIVDMKEGGWSKWREAEWCGFYLEYKVSRYLSDNNLTLIVKYVQNKGQDNLPDLDLYFPTSDFYGDLKASDIKNSETPGNDKETVMSCLNRDGRIWYVVYEHDTVKDSTIDGNPMTIFWNKMLGKTDRPLSYVSRMKHSVTFRKMSIYEINRANMNSVLRDFNQGHQMSGKDRNQKICIKKKEADNFVVYKYNRD